VYDCIFSNDGKTLATSSSDRTIRRFKIKPGAGEFVPGNDTTTLAGKLGHKSGVSALAFTPDDNYIIAGSEDGEIKKWSRAEGSCLETKDSEYGPVRAIKFPVRHPKAEEIFATLSGSTIVIWNLGEKMEIKKVLNTGDGKSRQGKSIQVWLVRPRVVQCLDSVIYRINPYPAGKRFNYCMQSITFIR